MSTSISAPAWDTQAHRLIYPIAPWQQGYRAITHRLPPSSSGYEFGRYICPECQEPVFPKRGTLVRWHFSHYPNSTCPHDFHGESDAHRLAKYLLGELLTERQPLKILGRKCNLCPTTRSHTLITYATGDLAQIEWTIQSGRGGSRADVALLREGQPRYLFEVYQTHRTLGSRPEPWFELLAGEILELDLSQTELRLQDLRSYLCLECQLPALAPEPLELRGLDGSILVPAMPAMASSGPRTILEPAMSPGELKLRIQKFYAQKRAEQARIQQLQAEYIAQNTPVNIPLRAEVQAQVLKLNSKAVPGSTASEPSTNPVPAIYTHRMAMARRLFRERVGLRRREAARRVFEQHRGISNSARSAKRAPGLILIPPVAQRLCRRA